MIIASALLCLSLNIYYEARGASLKEKEVVAAITLNRTEAKGFPRTICGVVNDKKAFSWNNKRYKKVVKEKKIFNQIVSLSNHFIKNGVSPKFKGRLYFNEKRLGKRYKTKYKPIVIGNFIVY